MDLTTSTLSAMLVILVCLVFLVNKNVKLIDPRFETRQYNDQS